MSTDSGSANPATTSEVSTDPASEDAATAPGAAPELPPEFRQEAAPAHGPTASACEPYRHLIEDAVGVGRNAMAIWQDLVDTDDRPH